MKLQVRSAGDGRTMYLTDAAGRVLPGQIDVSWGHSGPDHLPRIAVTFCVDGDRIALLPDPVETGDGTLPEALEAFGRLSTANKLRFIEAAQPPPQDPALTALFETFEAFRANFKS